MNAPPAQRVKSSACTTNPWSTLKRLVEDAIERIVYYKTRAQLVSEGATDVTPKNSAAALHALIRLEISGIAKDGLWKKLADHFTARNSNSK